MTRRPALMALACAAAALSHVGLSAQGADDLTRRQLEKARSFIEAEQYAEALRDFGLIVSSYPNSQYADDALLEIAKYQLLTAGDLTAAKAAIDSIIQKYGLTDSAPMAYVFAGRTGLARSRAPEDMVEALANFERVRALYPLSDAVPMSMYYAGETLRLTGRTDDALRRFQQVTSDFPRAPAAAMADLGAALCYVAQEQPLRAMETLQRIRARFPGTPEAQTAIRWNSTLYRLYIKSPAQAAYEFHDKGLPAGAGKLKDVFAIVIDADDNVFVANRSVVSVFNAEGAVTRSAASSPRCLFFDPKGRLVVIQKGAVHLDGAKGFALALAKPDGTARLLEDISAGVAWGTGEYLLSDESTKTLLKFSAAGKPLGTLTTGQPDRLAVNGLDELAALDRDAKAISILNREGKAIRKIPAQGPGYQLRNPVDIAFDALGHLYVLDKGHGSVLVFTPAGKLAATFTVAEKAPGALRNAAALALDAGGRLFIYDNSAERIHIYQ